MATISEKGHAKNVANLKTLITYVGTLQNYDPANKDLTAASLQKFTDNADTLIRSIDPLLASYNLAVAAQKLAFKGFNKMVSKAVNSFKSVTENAEQLERVNTLARKIKSTKPKKGAVIAPADSKGRSVSQQSYDNRLANFTAIIDVFEANGFKPNEQPLTIQALRDYCLSLKALTEAVDPLYAAIVNARAARNSFVYNKATGLLYIVNGVKNYLRSVYDTGSTQIKYVQSLKFKNLAK